MLMRSLLAVAFLFTLAPISTAAEPTVEELLTAPEKYSGQSVVLNKVKLFGGLNHDNKDGASWVHVVSAAGKVDWTIGKGRLTLASAVTESLTKATGAGFKINTPILIVCSVKAEKGGTPSLTITKMKFYDSKGITVTRVFGD